MRTLILLGIGLLMSPACKQPSAPVTVTDPFTGDRGPRCATKVSDADWYDSGMKAPIFEGLGGLDFPITTSSDEAQTYFLQGLMLSYGFNHAEAARSFYEAMRLDPDCAMCLWGFAYVLGPNYNAGMDPDHYERAYTNARKALKLAGKATPKERDLIRALATRYAASPPDDRSSLDLAWSNAMQKVYEKYPDDPDIATIYVESLMNLHPWDLYDNKTREPKEWTPRIVSLLEDLMQRHPRHPGAHHMYIHAVEASADPGRALASAELLGTLVPGSGHLIHMPSHIYINTGHYHLGSLANLAAVKVDSVYTSACHAQGAYPLAYYPHNYHFLSATATLEGNGELAWLAGAKVREHTALDIMAESGWGTLQHYYTIPYYIAVKFAMWDTILALTLPEEQLIYPRAVLHYARGMAWMGKRQVAKAREEWRILDSLARDSTLEQVTIWDMNGTVDLLEIAKNVLEAEIKRDDKKYPEAIALLEKAITIEEALNYNEPPDWFFSVRHHLGAVLIDAQQYERAEQVYLEDLLVFPENGWALVGLETALRKQKKDKEAREVRQRFEEAWKHADRRIVSSSAL
jgi:tetratricopeptide (TPR) repeat protein